MNGQEATPTPATATQSIWEKMRLDELAAKLDLSWNKIMYCGLYAGAGFLAGFLLGKYGKFVVTLLVASVIILWLLTHFGIAIIDLEKLKIFLGITSTENFTSIFHLAWQWAREHVLEAISVAVGFLIGFRVG